MERQQVIEVKTFDGVRFVRIEDIVSIRTANRHSVILLSNKNSIEAYHPIRWFEQILPNPDFCRCHNSYIVNCRYILGLDYSNYKVNMNGFGGIPFSRKNKMCLLQALRTVIKMKQVADIE